MKTSKISSLLMILKLFFVISLFSGITWAQSNDSSIPKHMAEDITEDLVRNRIHKLDKQIMSIIGVNGKMYWSNSKRGSLYQDYALIKKELKALIKTYSPFTLDIDATRNRVEYIDNRINDLIDVRGALYWGPGSKKDYYWYALEEEIADLIQEKTYLTDKFNPFLFSNDDALKRINYLERVMRWIKQDGGPLYWMILEHKRELIYLQYNAVKMEKDKLVKILYRLD